MLLEMDNAELLGLLDNDAVMDAKVHEALSVLDDFNKEEDAVAA
jgi:polyadenylate-binding protein